MSRERFIYKNCEVIYHEKNGEVLLDKRERVGAAPMVMNDIKPYQSVIDGSEISSRSRHREHLRQHNCVEVGNERLPPRKYEPPPGLKEDLLRAIKKGR
jgi:hypothetical protein